MAGLVVTLTHREIPRILDGFDPASADHLIVQGTIDFDASYPNTGGTVGEPMLVNKFGLDSVDIVLFEHKSGYTFTYDYTNHVVHAWYGDSNNGSDGPLIEVPNATNLSALTGVRFLAVGKIALPSEL